jgi:hypothetical protein
MIVSTHAFNTVLVSVVVAVMIDAAESPLIAQSERTAPALDSIDRRMIDIIRLADKPDCRPFEDSIPDYGISARACLASSGDTITYEYLSPNGRYAGVGRRVTANPVVVGDLTDASIAAWTSEFGQPVVCRIDGFRIGGSIKQYLLWPREAYVVRLISIGSDRRPPSEGPSYIEIQLVRQRSRTGRCAGWLQMPAWE